MISGEMSTSARGLGFDHNSTSESKTTVAVDAVFDQIVREQILSIKFVGHPPMGSLLQLYPLLLHPTVAGVRVSLLFQTAPLHYQGFSVASSRVICDFLNPLRQSAFHSAKCVRRGILVPFVGR